MRTASEELAFSLRTGRVWKGRPLALAVMFREVVLGLAFGGVARQEHGTTVRWVSP